MPLNLRGVYHIPLREHRISIWDWQPLSLASTAPLTVSISTLVSHPRLLLNFSSLACLERADVIPGLWTNHLLAGESRIVNPVFSQPHSTGKWLKSHYHNINRYYQLFIISAKKPLYPISISNSTITQWCTEIKAGIILGFLSHLSQNISQMSSALTVF